jgi:hypothetical protein
MAAATRSEFDSLGARFVRVLRGSDARREIYIWGNFFMEEGSRNQPNQRDFCGISFSSFELVHE